MKSLQAAERRQQQQMSSSQNIKLEEDPFSLNLNIRKEETFIEEMIKNEEPKLKILDETQIHHQPWCRFIRLDGECECQKISDNFHDDLKSSGVTMKEEEGADNKSTQKKTTISCSRNKNYIKNMDLNYFKAIINFVNSNIALPYLKASIQQENVKFTTFVNFMSQSKECAQNGIQAFREMILESQATDDDNLAACKKILKQLSEVFIKYFSVNCIMHSKINSKEAYLKYRFQMLRKIRNPEKYSNQTRKRSA